MITLEQKENAKKVLNEVKQLEEKYQSENHMTIEDVEGYYTDSYTLELWEQEKYTEESGEGWTTFEDFLIDFIAQIIEFG